QREDLRGLGVSAVDEHNRGQIICQGESAKFFGSQSAMGVGADHSADHYECSAALDAIGQKTERGAPARREWPGTRIDVEELPHPLRGGGGIVPSSRAADVGDRLIPVLDRVVTEPV